MGGTFREDGELPDGDSNGPVRAAGSGLGVGGTQREGWGDPSIAWSGSTGAAARITAAAGVSLLPCLGDQFAVVGRLLGGGEADVLVVADDAGESWVVKQYRQPGWAPSEEVLDRLSALRAGQSRQSWATGLATRHVVWIERWGTDPSSGLFFEVQEFIPGGALAGVSGDGRPAAVWSRLGQWPPEAIAQSLIEAVTGFHRLVGAHRDVKPTNVLVRSVDPLVLVVGDVGLSRSLADGPVRWTRLGGSPPYQAPEAALGKVSEAGDWWAVGMMIAEAVLGRHPLALEGGSLPDDRVLQTEVAERDIPLEGVRDPRLRLLCGGLLTRDSQLRWGLPQIAQWQAGGSPTTGFGATGIGVRRVRRVRFAGGDYDTPQGLAAAFAADPDRAARGLFLDRDPVLDSQLRSLLAAHELSEAVSVLDGYRSGSWQPVLLRLLAEMDPGLNPELAGQSMTPDAVARVAQQVVAAGQASPEQAQVMQWVVEHRVWRWWWELPGMGDAAEAAERLVAPVTRFPEPGELVLVRDAATWVRADVSVPGASVLLDSATIDGFWSGMQAVNAAWCVLLAAQPGPAGQALDAVLSQARPGLQTQGWWQEWARSDSPVPMRVLAACVIPLADIAAQQLSRCIADRARLRRQERQQAVRRQQWTQERYYLEREYVRLQPRLQPKDWDEMWGCWAIFFGLIGAFTLVSATGSLLQDLTSTPEDEWEPMFWTAALIWGTVALAVGAWYARIRTNRRTKRQHLRTVLDRPPPWDDPGMEWSNSQDNWVPKSQPPNGGQGRATRKG